MRHVAIALVLACNGCSSCRDAPAKPAPPVSAAPIASVGMDEASAPSPSPSPAPSADAPWELVAKRKSSDHPLWIDQVGTRVIVGDRSPLAWADGGGPLVAAPKVEAEYVAGVAGTYPSAVFLATDKRIHQLAGDGWRDLGPVPRLMRTLVTWGDRGAVLVSSVIVLDAMPTILPDERPATTLKALVADGEPPPSFDLDPAFGTFAASGTRDGHLWLLGFRAGKPGMWLAHVKVGQKTGYQLFPNSEKCDDAGFGMGVYRSAIVATSGERAFLLVVNDAAECLGPIGAWLYERSEKGFGNIPLPKKDVDALGTTILGRARDGTIAFASPGPDSIVWRRDVTGKTTKLTMPKGCLPTSIVTRDDGDTWMTARCEGHDGVYRRGRPQPPLAL